MEMAHTFSSLQPGVGSDMVENGGWCLGALDSLVLRSEKDAKDASGSPSWFWIGAYRRRKKALIRAGHLQDQARIRSKVVDVFDRRHAMWNVDGSARGAGCVAL
jgi:hypothetical protein